MAQGLIQATSLKAIADAIREKNGENGLYTPTQMDDKIRELQIGIHTFDADADETDIVSGKTAYVNDEKLTGTLEMIERDELKNRDISKVTITIGTESQDPSISFKTKLTNNKEVIPAEVTLLVGVRQEQLAETIGLEANKIKKGETILGITGTYEGEEEVNP